MQIKGINFRKTRETFSFSHPKSRFPQILHDDAHFLFQEAVAELVVADGFQLGHEGVVLTHPAVERLESGGLGVRGTIQLGERYLGVCLHLERFFCHHVFSVSFLQIYSKFRRRTNGMRPESRQMPTML